MWLYLTAVFIALFGCIGQTYNHCKQAKIVFNPNDKDCMNNLTINIIAVFSGLLYSAFAEKFFEFEIGCIAVLFFLAYISTNIIIIQKQQDIGVITSTEDLPGIIFFISLIICPLINILIYTVLYCKKCYEIDNETEISLMGKLKFDRFKMIVNLFVSLIVACLDYFYREFIIVDFETKFFICALSLILFGVVTPSIIDNIFKIREECR